MFLLYISIVFFFGWRVCAPFRALLADPRDVRRDVITTALCSVPMAWCVGYTAAITAAWVFAQSANLIGGYRPEVSIAAWSALAVLCALSFCSRGASYAHSLKLSKLPCWCAAIVVTIWVVAITLTFGVTTVTDGVISSAQNLVPDLYSHTAIIRSFSMGYNFPTEYPFFHGDAIRYHFLFYFGGGVLEALGAPFSVALNLPSALAFGCLLSLAAFLSWTLTSSSVAAWFAIVFALFRSSMSWVDWIAALSRSAREANPIYRESFWFGVTPYEDWGIFSLNVHLNQRHLMHGLALLLVVLVACLLTPPLKPSWRSRTSLISYGCVGAVIGCGAYWNGNAFMATMLALVPLVCVSAFRAKALIVGIFAAVTGGTIVLLVTHGAVGSTPLRPSFHFGFLCESSAFLDVARYAVWLFGALPIVALVAGWRGGVRGRTLWLCGLMPIAFIFLARVTPIAPQGHKFINAGTLIWSIVAAGFVAHLLASERMGTRLGGQLLIFVMILTGIVDAGALRRLAGTRFGYPVDDEAIRWVGENTPREAIFLSSARGDTAQLLAGRRVLIGPKSLTSETGHPYDERVLWLRQVARVEPPQQVEALRQAGVTHIATEVCREMKGLLVDRCPALPEVDVLVRNPLLIPLYSSPEMKIMGVPRD